MSAVYLDSMGHLWSADRSRLHDLAASIGMRRDWFQDRPRLYHYDVMTKAKRAAAIRAGAIRVSPRELVALIRGADA